MPRTSCARSRCATSRASGVSTITRSSTPTAPPTRPVPRPLHPPPSYLPPHREALDTVALGLGLDERAHRGPCADVAPADVAGDHRDAVRFLHHRVVHRGLRHAREGFGVELDLAGRVAVRGLRALEAAL